MSAVLAFILAAAGAANAAPPAELRALAAQLAPLAAPSARQDSAWASAVARGVEKLLDAGCAFRAAEWALALGAWGAEPDPRGAALLARLPARSLVDDELLYLGGEATRRGKATVPALLALARHAQAERRPLVATALVAGARALGADSAAVVAVGAGFPPPRRLGFFTLGLLAPVNGRLARQGEAMARGAQLALEEANRGARFPLALAIGDTRGEPLAAARAAAELAAAGVGALAGDALAATTIPAAAAAEAAGLPLVTPAAGRTDLGTIGRFIFQATVPRPLQAEALARAAVGDLGYRRLAVLAPDSPEGGALAERFAAAAARHGGKVVARQTYRAGATNFGELLGQLAPLAPDAIFIPGTPRELMAAIPQLAYYEVGTRVLALEDLGLPEVLAATREFLDPGVFAESFYGVPALGGESFAARFRRRFRTDPDPDAARGFVAVRVLAAAIEAGARSPEAIRAFLAARAALGTGILDLGGQMGEVPLFRVERSGPVEPLRPGGR